MPDSQAMTPEWRHHISGATEHVRQRAATTRVGNLCHVVALHVKSSSTSGSVNADTKGDSIQNPGHQLYSVHLSWDRLTFRLEHWKIKRIKKSSSWKDNQKSSFLRAYSKNIKTKKTQKINCFLKNKKTKFKICRLRATERFSKHPVAEFIYKFYYWWLLAILTAETLQISTVCGWKKMKKCDFWHLQQNNMKHVTSRNLYKRSSLCAS